ncbi:hypothetical protein Pogu_2708 [Pyrobaculum oguniense TE7]|uniref:Uncharacterized protein n=1 Tax=Pyrobaculum oguniense (strain DSM 13380 / JCM 10595 / TE7) TaxID=698757 RepID=H6QDW5_PYROT|nr:hypothetical protein Pogu_2708 [Pyrobaculum oguniense TE7]
MIYSERRVGKMLLGRAGLSTVFLYLLNLPLYLFNPLFYPPLFSLGVASYHAAFFGFYTLWGWVLLVGSYALGALFHPAAGVALAFVGGFFVALALGRGGWRLLSLLLYVALYVVLTNLLALASVPMPYLVEREDVPDPAHAPLYFVYYLALHWAFNRLVKPGSVLESAARLYNTFLKKALKDL